MKGGGEEECGATAETVATTSTKTPNPVGVTIAMQQMKEQKQLKQQSSTSPVAGTDAKPRHLKRKKKSGSSKQRDSPRRRRSGSLPARQKKGLVGKKSNKSAYKKPVSSFRMFVEGTSLYLLCLILPSFLTYVYQNYSYYSRDIVVEPESSSSLLMNELSNLNTALWENPVAMMTSSYGYWAYEQAADRFCPYGVEPNSFTSYLCPVTANANGTVTPAESVYSPDIKFDTWKRDGIRVVATAILLALIRFILVRAFAPASLRDKDSLTAMVRIKSIHLLSHDYQSTLTPSTSAKKIVTLSEHLADDSDEVGRGSLLIPPFLPPPLPDVDESDHPLGLGLDDDNIASPTGASTSFIPTMAFDSKMPLPQPDMGPVAARENEGAYIESDDDDVAEEELEEEDLEASDDEEYDDEEDEEPEEEGETLLRVDDNDNVEMVGIREAPGIDMDIVVGADDGDAPSSLSRLYGGPRFATAIFRFLYSATASGLAFHWFADSHFWPWYLGGHGNTVNCWDLNGFAVTMDSDFDSRNRVLKNYFLWQASYHLHSWAFDFILLILAMIQRVPRGAAASTAGASAFSSSDQKARWAYLRSLLQHFVAVVLIAIAYVFSSLRRLVAIGMFAFDVSSAFLHLLQICLNAKSPSLKNERVIAAVYYGAVMPSFIMMRFITWPALWFSATFESQNWFRQLENTLFPRAALLLQAVLQLWILLCMVLTSVYFRRLRQQPHMRRILHSRTVDSDIQKGVGL